MKEKVKIMVDSGMSYRDIGKELGISSSTVSNMYNNKYDYVDKSNIRKNKAIEMRLNGLKISDIAEEMNLNISTVSGYLKGIKVDIKRTTELGKQIEVDNLIKKGYTPLYISIKTGLSISTVYFYTAKLGLKSNLIGDVKKKNKELCKCLFRDGYSIDEISRITLLEEYIIEKYVNGISVHTIKPFKKTNVMTKKKKVKATPTQMEQRDVLGKGIESGVYSTSVKMREDRDEGRVVNVRYMDYGGSIKNIDIRVRDGASDDQARERWCKKFGKEFVC